jgi:osmotically-inducible protein OsmY
MSKLSLLYHPSLEGSTTGDVATRQSLFDSKDEFITRIAPVGVAAIYFGKFSLSPQDMPLSRQALFKLSFLYRHFLQPGGLKVAVNRQTAVFSGTVANRALVTMAEILALQIEGILLVQDETVGRPEDAAAAPATGSRELEAARERVQFLFATDQTLRSGLQVNLGEAGGLVLHGEVGSVAQKHWAEQVAETAAGSEVLSRVTVGPLAHTPAQTAESLEVDDESLQALVLFRLRLVRETEHLPIRVKANRGVVTMQGKVRTEALRQRAENLARSTLGLRELRSMLSIVP